MSKIAYYRTSSNSQSIEAQRTALGSTFDKEFIDHAVSGAVPAMIRPAFREMIEYVRSGDVISVYAVDRLGRDALDVQKTIRHLLAMDVSIEVLGLGRVGQGVGELICAVLSQIADMERLRIADRCAQGRKVARASLAETGRTHRNKTSLGRRMLLDPQAVANWRKDNRASMSDTAKHFNISIPTVKRYCRKAQTS